MTFFSELWRREVGGERIVGTYGGQRSRIGCL
jgi:hypothetical protein